MNRLNRWMLMGCLGVSLMGSSGCELMKRNPAATGAVIGGAAGIGAGAAIDDKNRWRGAAIGGAAGTAVGAGTGYAIGKSRK